MNEISLEPRSAWTAILPKSTPVGEDYQSLNYFTQKPEIEFARSDKEMIYHYRDPQRELNSLLKESLSNGLADLNFNYAISQITPKIYTVRGQLTRCANSNSLRVLLLLGKKEEPTDVLKKNQRFFLENFPKFDLSVPTPSFSLEDRSIHVFDLIELLISLNVYHSRNDGYYGPLVENSIKILQDQKNLPITGVYDKWLENSLLVEEVKV